MKVKYILLLLFIIVSSCESLKSITISNSTTVTFKLICIAPNIESSPWVDITPGSTVNIDLNNCPWPYGAKVNSTGIKAVYLYPGGAVYTNLINLSKDNYSIVPKRGSTPIIQ